LNDLRPTILITGIAGNLGTRLLPLLSEFRVVGVDVSPVAGQADMVVRRLDLGWESSCVELVRLLRESGAEAVVHLASASEPLRAGDSNREHTWQVNVAGTARVMEAISEVNRHLGRIRKFITISSGLIYGSETRPLVDEAAPLGAHTLSYAVQKAEADEAVRYRSGSMGRCSTYLLRPPIFAGASVESYMVSAIRGQAFGSGSLAHRLRRRFGRLPFLLPMGKEYPQKQFQFVHVYDMARLIAWLLQRRSPENGEVLTLNVAGSGSPVSIAQCAEIARTGIVHLPSRRLCMQVLRLLWKLEVTSVPPEAFPYMTGSHTMSTKQLRELLAGDYAKVIQYSNEAALRDSVAEVQKSQAIPADAVPSPK